ncbi:MAG: Mrp/NBP35 family ATP-binding protein [Actinomycetota bacterium]
MEIELIHSALAKVIDPELRLPLTELDMVGEVSFRDGHANVEIKLTITTCPAATRIQNETKEAVEKVVGVKSAEVRLSVMTQAERDALKLKLRGGKPLRHNPFGKDTLTNIFLIGSGKGGVGKSTLTANLAVALADKGLRVGLIDADIFGFSIPNQLGIKDKPTRVDELILPPVGFGVKVISIGMFLENNQPVAWRGPMLHRAIEQFLSDVFWGDLDILLIDLPPGTGDVAISIGQLLPTAKAIVVTTPQEAASEVAERSGAVSLQTGQSIFGVIENLSYLESNGQRLEIFGSGGGQTVAKRLSELSNMPVPLLGQIPISTALREGSDQGKPLMASAIEDSAKNEIARIAMAIAKVPRNLSGRKLPLAGV